MRLFTGAFSIYNTSIYSEEKLFKTPAILDSGTTVSATDNPQNSTTIVVALVVSIAVLAIIAGVLYFLMKRRKTKKKRHAHPQFPGLEDLIEMRSRTHSGGPETRGNRDLMEIGRATLFIHLSFVNSNFLQENNFQICLHLS